MKDITLFGRPYLFRCNKCVNGRARVKRHCDICNCDVSVGSWSIHRKSKKHPDNKFDY
jgi:hypothetical protein